VALAALFGGAALAGDRLDWPAAVQGVVDYLGRCLPEPASAASGSSSWAGS
jgi:hypothetical protein